MDESYYIYKLCVADVTTRILLYRRLQFFELVRRENVFQAVLVEDDLKGLQCDDPFVGNIILREKGGDIIIISKHGIP